MKNCFFTALSAIILAIACGSTETTDQDQKPQKENENPSKYSGYFKIDKVMTGTDCHFPAILSDFGNITVSSTEIDFLGFKGTWNNSLKQGTGSQTRTVLITVDPLCSRQYILDFDIVYSDFDHFSGTVDVEFKEGCGGNLCNTSYDVSGERQ